MESSLIYGLEGVDTLIPIGDQVAPLTLGIQIINRGEESVVVTDFRVMEVEGMTVTPELLITQPRFTGQIGDAQEFPPEQADERWTAEAERPFGEITLPPTDAGGEGDVLVLMRATVEPGATYARAKGYVVEGTEGGVPFRDVVDTYTVFCRDGGTSITPTCEEYQEEHGY